MGWMAPLGLALIGAELPEDDASSDPARPPSAEAIRAALTAAGHGPAELVVLVGRRQAAGEPWPFPVSAEQRPGIGAAQFVSVLRAVTDALDVHSWQHRPPARGVSPTAADRRLLADVPPHW